MFRNYKYDEKAERHSFEIHNVDLSIVNGLRRAIMTDIPMVGFRGEGESEGEGGTSVRILANSGPLHNEFMTHRIGLLPIHFNDTELEAYQDGKYTFFLDVKNNGNDVINVTTKHMAATVRVETAAENTAPEDEAGVAGAVADVVVTTIDATKNEIERWFPANKITKEHILITRLRAGEVLKFEASPVQSTAREHASFSPVSLCTLSFMQDALAIKEQGVTDILQKERTFIKNKYGDPIAFLFELECETSLAPMYLINKAIDVMNLRMTTIIEELSNEPSEKITRKWCDTMPGYEFTIEKEDDTIGHILQSTMYDTYIRQKEPIGNYNMSYCGYVCPHPLDHKVLFRMFLKPNAENSEDGGNDADVGNDKAPEDLYVTTFIKHCSDIKAKLEEVKLEWSSFQMK